MDKPEAKKHKELFAARVKRDQNDFIKLKSLFDDHNPMEVGENLVALDTGLCDDKGAVSCDKAEDIGSSIHTEMTGKTFANFSFKRKKQITKSLFLR